MASLNQFVYIWRVKYDRNWRLSI